MSMVSYSLENSSDLTTLANNIRSKTGSTATMSVAQMASAVSTLKPSGSGTLWRRVYTEETQASSRTVAPNGGTLDLDLGLPSGTKFLFIITLNSPTSVTTAKRDSCYVFYCNGVSVMTLSQSGGVGSAGYLVSGVQWGVSFSIAVNNNTNTYHFVITNNQTGYGDTLNLYNGTYNNSIDGRVWGNLFYISSNEIADPESNELPIDP